MSLIAASSLRRINDFYSALFDRFDRYMYLGVGATARWPRDAAVEHKAIRDAVLARDAELAIKLSQTHIRRTEEIVEAVWTARAAPASLATAIG
jgi:DNA-binding GntR family transcriptional regulator